MCGIGRSGSLFAFELENVEPDLVCIAKGLGAGYQPIGATIANDKVYQSIANGSGFFQHGHTYMAHPVACACALATINSIIDEQLISCVNHFGSKLKQALINELGPLPNIGDIRGKGLLLGIELVKDKQSKAPLPATTQAHNIVKAQAMQNGLMCYPMAGTIDGKNGHHILLAPPFILQDQHIEEIVTKLKSTLNEVSQTWI